MVGSVMPKKLSERASTSILYDNSKPTGTRVQINSGDSSTSNTEVTLNLSASDETSGVSGYLVSESSDTDNLSEGNWVTFTTTSELSTSVSFTFSSESTAGTHKKTVYAWFKDAR